MTFKQLAFAIFILAVFNVNAQELTKNFNLATIESKDLASLDLNFSKYQLGNNFELYSPTQNISDLMTDDRAQNIMLIENANQAELEAYLNSMLMRRHPLEKTGRILTYIGVPLAIIGGIMVAGADELYYECVNGNCSGDARGGFGVVLLGAGSGMSITGAILWIIGSKK
jgi:hypothetical protein